MYDLITKNFKGKQIYNFVWNGRPCWVAVDVVGIFDYIQKSKTVFNCIRRENFEIGVEYDFLDGEELKEFKEVFSEQLGDTKFASKVVIFYEEGLYGFINYTEMPIGVEFRSWIRREVMPTLRKKGYYIADESINLDEEILKTSDVKVKNTGSSFGDVRFSSEKLESYRMALETAQMFKPILDNITKDSIYKFLYLKKIFSDAGIELPKFIDEELM